MEKSSRLYGAGWILSSARLGFAGEVGKGRFFSHSGCARRERFSAGFRFGGRGRAKNGHNGRFLGKLAFSRGQQPLAVFVVPEKNPHGGPRSS